MPLDADSALSRLHGVRPCAGGFVALCPAHPDRNPSLSIREGKNGRALIHCFAGCSREAVMAALELEPSRLEPVPGVPKNLTHLRSNRQDDSTRIEAARRLWRQAKPLAGTPAEAYLEGRGIRLPAWPKALRYHPACPHPSGHALPALVAAIAVPREGKLQLRAVHRIFITPDGRRAEVEPPKAALGTVKGGSVYLSRPAATLVISEGIEDALSVMAACQGDSRFRSWSHASAISAANMPALELPPCVREVVIAADADDAGRKAAQALAARCLREGVNARIAYPPRGLKDFNDVALAERREEACGSA